MAFGAATLTTNAQTTSSAYFIEGYTFKHELNPAFSNEQDYFSFPVLGNLNVSMRGNLRADNILYNVDGQTALFLNPNVSESEFLSGIKDENKVIADAKINVLNAGFKKWGGYNTVGLNLRANAGVKVPGELLKLAKVGAENKTYDISDFNAHADTYMELAFGHSRKLDKNWEVGAKLKFLLGVANIDAKFKQAKLTLGDNEWTAIANAEVQASMKGKYKIEEKDRGAEGSETHHEYVSGIDFDGFGINGFGLAADLGAVYTLDNTWKFSASLLDLGFISWGNNHVASTNGERTFNTDAYLFNVDENKDNSFEREFDRFSEGLSAVYELQDNGNKGGRTTMLGATLNLGAEYRAPFYEPLTFGLLSTTRIQGEFSWTKFRLSANVAPCKVFSAGLNVGLGTYGIDLGWILNLHTNGLNMFLGMDHTLGKLAKQGLPLSSNGSINFGINFLF